MQSTQSPLPQQTAFDIYMPTAHKVRGIDEDTDTDCMRLFKRIQWLQKGLDFKNEQFYGHKDNLSPAVITSMETYNLVCCC